MSTYSSTFVYADDAAKAKRQSSKPHQEGPAASPWAALPKACLGETTTTALESFAIRAPVVQELSLEELKKNFLRKLRTRKEAKEEAAYQVELAHRKVLMQQIESRYAPREEALVFSHSGTAVQPVGHDAKVSADRLDRLVEQERQRGAESQLSVARSSSSLDGPDPTKYMYLDPVQRQRLKYSVMEERRLAQFKETLTSNGWTTSNVPRAQAKTPHFPENKNTLTDEEKAKIEAQFEALKFAAKEAADVRAAKFAAMKVEADALGDAHLSDADLMRRQHERGRSSATPDVMVAAEERDTAAAAAAGPLYPRELPMKPEAVYRPELPLSKLPSKEVLDSIAPFLDQPRSLVAPPWGRQTSLDDKWEKVRVFDSRAQSKKFETIGKLEVDHELRVVRDHGLLRRERQMLLKALDPKTLEIIKGLPADYGRVQKSSKPMKPMGSLPAAGLR